MTEASESQMLRTEQKQARTSRGIHGTSCDETSFDELVRITTHDLTVFTRSWLSLIGIDNQIPRTGVLLESGFVHEGPFQPRREPCTTTTSETGVFDLFDEKVMTFEDDVLGTMPISSSLSR